MKYILLFLLSFAFGQEQIKELWYIDNDGISSRVVTYNDILDYVEECYNDSIHTYYSPMPTCVGIDDGDEDILNTGLVECWHDSTIYIEHITPTFQGFAEWVEK